MPRAFDRLTAMSVNVSNDGKLPQDVMSMIAEVMAPTELQVVRAKDHQGRCGLYPVDSPNNRSFFTMLRIKAFRATALTHINAFKIRIQDCSPTNNNDDMPRPLSHNFFKHVSHLEFKEYFLHEFDLEFQDTIMSVNSLTAHDDGRQAQHLSRKTTTFARTSEASDTFHMTGKRASMHRGMRILSTNEVPQFRPLYAAIEHRVKFTIRGRMLKRQQIRLQGRNGRLLTTARDAGSDGGDIQEILEFAWSETTEEELPAWQYPGTYAARLVAGEEVTSVLNALGNEEKQWRDEIFVDALRW